MKSNLIACKDCGKEVNRTASRCPHCGKKMPLTAVELIVAICLAVALLLVLSWGKAMLNH